MVVGGRRRMPIIANIARPIIKFDPPSLAGSKDEKDEKDEESVDSSGDDGSEYSPNEK